MRGSRVWTVGKTLLAIGWAASVGCGLPPLEPLDAGGRGGAGGRSGGAPGTPPSRGSVDASATAGIAGGGTAGIGGGGGSSPGGAVDGGGSVDAPTERPTPVGTRPLGVTCLSGGECMSGFCVDGVCCNEPCEGTCRSCRYGGSEGRCLLARPGQPNPRGLCITEAPASCGYDGACDGTGQCRRYQAGTECSPGICTDETAIVGRKVCDGRGACRDGPNLVCAPYTCDPVANRCRTACASDADCTGSRSCLNGSCQTRVGVRCQLDGECASGHCVRGTCCNTACEGPCTTCDLPGLEGTCLTVPVGTADPTGLCFNQAPETCGETGLCDGAGGCLYGAAGASCGGGCAGPVIYESATCDGQGSCVAADRYDCTPYRCDPVAVCLNGCMTDAQCAEGYSCIDWSCRRPGPVVPCQEGSECLSGFCSGGACCDRDCPGPCQSCLLAGSIGTCTRVPNPDPGWGCPSPPAASP